MECNGICLTASDIGLPGNDVAYPHPACPEHGEPHPFELQGADHLGRLTCSCGGYQTDHPDQLNSALLQLEALRESAGGYYQRAAELHRAAAVVEIAEVLGSQKEKA